MNRRFKVILVFVGVFLAGAICGGAVASRVMKQDRPDWRRGTRLQLMDRFNEELKLTEAQKVKIAPIVSRAQEETQNFRRESIRGIAVVMERMHTEMAAELTPEQRLRLEDMRKRFRERADRMRREFRDQDRPARP